MTGLSKKPTLPDTVFSPEELNKIHAAAVQQWQREMTRERDREFFAILKTCPPDPLFSHMGDLEFLRQLHISPA